MPAILTPLITEAIDDAKYVRLTAPFLYDSDILGRIVQVPKGFICDFESVPLFKGTSKRGGVIHDYLSRYDSIPLVDKATAARVYLELMAHRDGLLGGGIFKKADRFIRRWGKYGVVRVWPEYFHRLPVMADYEAVVREV